jgi:hypothetical protein
MSSPILDFEVLLGFAVKPEFFKDLNCKFFHRIGGVRFFFLSISDCEVGGLRLLWTIAAA